MHLPPLPFGKYYFELFKKTQKQELVRFLQGSFRVDEPLNRASKISGEELESCLEEVLDRSLALPSSSLLARSQESHDIVGCALTSLWRREDSVAKKESDFNFKTTRKEVAVVGEILNELHERFWALQPDHDVVIHYPLASVDNRHRGTGLAQKMCNWADDEERVRSYGATGVVGEATSIVSQRLLAQYGYKTIDTILLKTKLDPETGKQILLCDNGTDRINLVFKDYLRKF